MTHKWSHLLDHIRRGSQQGAQRAHTIWATLRWLCLGNLLYKLQGTFSRKIDRNLYFALLACEGPTVSPCYYASWVGNVVCLFSWRDLWRLEDCILTDCCRRRVGGFFNFNLAIFWQWQIVEWCGALRALEFTIKQLKAVLLPTSSDFTSFWSFLDACSFLGGEGQEVLEMILSHNIWLYPVLIWTSIEPYVPISKKSMIVILWKFQQPHICASHF